MSPNPYTGWCPSCCDWCPGRDAEGWCLATPASARKGPEGHRGIVPAVTEPEPIPECGRAPRALTYHSVSAHQPDFDQFEVYLDGERMDHVRYAATNYRPDRAASDLVSFHTPSGFSERWGRVEIRAKTPAVGAGRFDDEDEDEDAMLIVIDTETTALKPEEGGIWDLAAVAMQDGEIIAEFETLVWPGRDALQPKHLEVVQQVSRIPPGELLLMLNSLDVPTPAAARELLIRWMFQVAGVEFRPSVDGWKQTRKTVRATSFNVGFDRAWLEAQPWETPYYVRALGPAELTWAPCVMDTAAGAMGAAGVLERHPTRNRWKWPKLPRACEFFGVPFTETHRALADARAAAQLATKLGIN